MVLLSALVLSLAAQVGAAAPKPEEHTRLVIVAPRAFQVALAPYAVHKRKQVEVELAVLENVLGAKGAGDPPERLKRYLYAAWKQRRAKYVLLVGDADVLPVRYMVLDRITSEAFDYAFYPSDLYYGDLAKRDGSFEDWNRQRDGFHAGYFGEVRGEKNKQDPINYDGVDYRPEIGFGRWPVSTVAQVKAVVAKTIAYENAVLSEKATGSRRAAMIGVDGWVDCRSMMDGLANRLPSGWSAEKRYGPLAPSEYPAPSANEIVRLLNEGLSLILHTGHGWDDGWERSLSSGDLAKLSNAHGLPVMFSAGCSTGRFATLPPYEPYEDVAGVAHPGTNAGEVFDSPPPPPACYARGAYNKSGLGEKIVLLPNAGAVAYIGCNTGSQPAALSLMSGFVDGLAATKQPRLGDLWTFAIKRFFEREGLATLKPNADWYPPSIFFQGMKFMVYGDPSLVLPEPKD